MSKALPTIWEGQILHAVALATLIPLTYSGWIFLKQPFPVAFWIAVAVPVIHQIFVWLAWRFELHNAIISQHIGPKPYVVLFFILFGGRFVSLFSLAWLDNGSANLSTTVVIILTTLLSVPGIYAMYSVKRYFGMVRATGADHFDPQYRDMPLVKEGIFRFTSNAMYLYAFLLFWVIAVGFNSSAALLVALFSHIYIWVHFYATEKPDMEYIYSSSHHS